MKVMVTGGAGYIGSHCVLALLKKNHDVIIVDNLSTGHKETVDTLKKYGNVDFYESDLRKPEEIQKPFDDNKDVGAVMHFAAYSQVGESVKDPQKYYMNNVYGSLNLLNQMIKHGVDKIVFSSTAATYGNPITDTIDETHPQNPINPYGHTKLTIEKIMDNYREPYGIRSARLRYFNVAGADSQGRVGEWHDPETHLIPNVLKAAVKEESFPLFGTDYDTPDGTCIRDYINVEDLADAHVLALDYLDKGGETDFFNLGTKTGNSVKEVVDVCEEVTGKKIKPDIRERRAGDPSKLVANNEKAKKVLGWQPKRDLKYSVQTAYNWEKSRTNNQS